MQVWGEAFPTALNTPLRPEICIRHYAQARCVGELRGSRGDLGGGRWEAGLSVHGVRAGVEEWAIEARVAEGTAIACAAGVCVTIAHWSREQFLLLPGVIYAGNRFESRKVGYPPKGQVEDCRLDVATHIADIPRLEIGEGDSRIQLLAGALAVPAVAAFDPVTRTAWIVLAPANAGPFELGFDFRENDARTVAELRITAPGVREQRYRAMETAAESPDRAADFAAGEAVGFRLEVHRFPCAEIQGLFDRLFELRPAVAPEPGPPTDFREGFALVEGHYNREFWWEEAGLYRTGFVSAWSNNPYQTGWCGGIIAEYALLAGGARGITRERCLRHLGHALTAGIAPSGLFFGKYADDAWRSDCFFDEGAMAWRQPLTLTRRQGDALLYALRAFAVLEQAGDDPVPTEWVAGARRVAETLVAIWDRFGQFGQWLHQFTGAVVVGNSASGAIIPAALCAAERRFGGGEFLRVALAAAGDYYERFTRCGVTTGGPADALQCPDSESSYALVESYVELHEATGDALWLARAGEAARQFATWVMAYDYRFPADSLFGRLGIRTTGAVIANAQNGHAAPGICTHSGLGLVKLSRATGDPRYAELAQAIAGVLAQCISTAARPMVAKDGQVLPPGWINERINTTDWDDNLGGVFHGPCWCEVSLLLSVAELPESLLPADATQARLCAALAILQ